MRWPRRVEFCAGRPQTREGEIDTKVLAREHVAKLNSKETS